MLANSASSGFVRVDVLSGVPTPIGLRGQSPVWAPDGKRFGLSGGRLGFPFPSIASLANPDDVNALSVRITGQAWPTDWSNDGRFIVGHALHADTGLDLWATDITTTPMTRRYLLQAPGDQQDQKISPDGRWVAYASNERSGTFEVYVRAFPEGPGLWRVSTAGGRLPDVDGGRPRAALRRTGRHLDALRSDELARSSTPARQSRSSATTRFTGPSVATRNLVGSTTCATAVESSSACQSPTLPRYPSSSFSTGSNWWDGQASAEHSRVPPAGQPAMVSGIREAAVPEAVP